MSYSGSEQLLVGVGGCEVHRMLSRHSGLLADCNTARLAAYLFVVCACVKSRTAQAICQPSQPCSTVG